MIVLASIFGTLADAYQRGIVETGKQPEFLLFCSFLLSFSFIRTSAHLIRAQVRWWPGNVQVGDTHVHHLVWGILLLLTVGYLGLAFNSPSPWREIEAVLFGIGMGLTPDEFALWLHLKDVYWEAEGRSSIDAVIVAATVGFIILLGVRGWADASEKLGSGIEPLLVGHGVVGIVLAVINGIKGKLALALVSPFAAPVGAVGAVRLARPNSPWSHLFYKERLSQRSRERFDRPDAEPALRSRIARFLRF